MWLLDTTSLELSAFFDKTPHYVILSHTWGSEEVSFQDIQGSHDRILQRAGYKKIKNCCAKALEAGFRYVWIDTCCIDKTNSTELSEAINTMFRWYKNSTTCYAYLEDVQPLGPRFVGSRWFTRGWTLQELIAPTDVQFFDHDWNDIGSRENLANTIGTVTGIPVPVLLNNSSSQEHCVAEIMSWAAGRHTTRIEDRAYSLLGLFGVNMPLIYGEGENAFLRLQLEIMKISTDHSILAWKALPFSQGQKRGALATTVDEFRESGHVRSMPTLDESSFEMTNLGLRITLPCISRKTQDKQRILFACLNCGIRREYGKTEERLGIWLNEAASNGTPLGRFARAYLDTMPQAKGRWKSKPKSTTLCIIQPYFRVPLPQEIDIAHDEAPFCLEYSNLVDAGYRLEAYAADVAGPHIWQEGYKVNVLASVKQLWNPDPMIFFFKHFDMTRRLWIMFVRSGFVWTYWLMVDSSSNPMDTPEFISKFRPLETNGSRLKPVQITHRTTGSELYDGSLVKVSLGKAVVSEKLGLMAKVTICPRNHGSYLEEIPKSHYVALKDALTSYSLRLLEDGAESAQLIKVL